MRQIYYQNKDSSCEINATVVNVSLVLLMHFFLTFNIHVNIYDFQWKITFKFANLLDIVCCTFILLGWAVKLLGVNS